MAQEDWPAHLRDDAPFMRCGTCGRKSWAPQLEGTPCLMSQPDGSRCYGIFLKPEVDGTDAWPVGTVKNEQDGTRRVMLHDGTVEELLWRAPRRVE